MRDLGDLADGRKAAALVSRLLAGAVDQVQLERVIRDAAGRPVQVLAHASTLRDPEGAPMGVVAYLHDLTALRDVERRRQQQEDFFLALSQRASDLVIVLDALGQVLYASPALGSTLGHDPLDVISEDVRDFVHPEDRSATTALLEDVVDGGERTATLRIRDVRRRLALVRGDDGQPARHRRRRRASATCATSPSGSAPSARCAPPRPATERSPTAPTRAFGWRRPRAAPST